MIRRLLVAFAVGFTALAGAAQAQAPAPLTLTSSAFAVKIDPVSGSVSSIVAPDDPARMNWVSGPENTPWLPRSSAWGLGFADLGAASLHRSRWETAQSVKVDAATKTVRTVYRTGDLQVEVVRALVGDTITERYAFTNMGTAALRPTGQQRTGLAIATPFNDHYTSTADVLEHRSHAHVWTGGASSWVATRRMGGRGPHMGMVLTEGALTGYSIIDRDRGTLSNTRGAFLMHPDIPVLQPGETKAVAWTLFWYRDWADFFAQAGKRSSQYVKLEASRYTLFPGETADLTIAGAAAEGGALALGNTAIPLVRDGAVWRGQFKADALGEKTLQFTSASGAVSRMVLNVSAPLDQLMAARAKFIVEHQQANGGAEDKFDGAYLVYDNQMDAVLRKFDMSDRNDGRERVGMGVFLARWLRAQPTKDPAIMTSLERYYTFVSTKLQRPDGYVLNSAGVDRKRLYNWPWVAELHLEMARLTGRRECLDRMVKTVENFYANGGTQFYPIGMPISEPLAALKQAGMTAEYDRLLPLYIAHGEYVLRTGTNYPASEVNFEQSIVGPATVILLELYRATGDQKWLDGARKHLALLEQFNGQQPDHHLNDVAIRHWDGYWFGRERMWGDTFPHYWSTVTADAFSLYAEATGDQSYAARADNIIRNNLSLFTPEGRASAAFIYPASVNGMPAKLSDPFANDQDWAFVHALRMRDR
jgi:hypothetical protein